MNIWMRHVDEKIYITCVKGIWNEISIRKVFKSLCWRAINRWRKTWVGCEIIYVDRLNTKSEIWTRSLKRRIEKSVKRLKFLSSFLSSNHFSFQISSDGRVEKEWHKNDVSSSKRRNLSSSVLLRSIKKIEPF